MGHGKGRSEVGNGRRSNLGAAALLPAALLVLAVPAQSLAGTGQVEYGTINCGSFIAYSHTRFNSNAQVFPPGSLNLHLWYPGDGLWHVWDVNGNNSGYWQSTGLPLLDFGATKAACRNFG